MSRCLPRVLVVDDMPDNLFLMNGLLEDHCEVVQATSGAEALAIVMSQEPPDMVLLDIMMPGMDGYEVLRRIRQHPATATIPVAFLTALASRHDQDLGRDLGAIDYLTKPVNPVEVVARVEAHVRAARRASLLEELSGRLARLLQPAEWQRLFAGDGDASIRFDEETFTVLHAESTLAARYGEGQGATLPAEVAWLAKRQGGTLEPTIFGAAVVYFRDAGAAVRMAMELQRSAVDLRLRIGVHTGAAAIATFEANGGTRRLLLGAAAPQAARVAAGAASGSISLSPTTYAIVQADLEREMSSCLVTEEFDAEDLSQVCVTPMPTAMSSFAGLGLT